jgi:hypothetical protein
MSKIYRVVEKYEIETRGIVFIIEKTLIVLKLVICFMIYTVINLN